jgi:hypothetical protein
MGNLGSLIAIPLTIILVPWVLHRMPYFRRPDVVARRAFKARLPGWMSLVEMIFFAVSVCGLVLFFFSIERRAHHILHQGRNILAIAPPAYSIDFIFWLIQMLAPVVMALPLSMLVANLMSWLTPAIRNKENELMAEGVPGYTWHELNFGLIKFSLVATPVCLILAAISLIRV